MPTYLLYGPNTFTSTEKRRQLTDRYLKKQGATNCGYFQGAELTIDRYRDTILTVPLLATTRLAIIVNGLSESKAPIRQYLEQSLPTIPDQTIVVFHEVKSVDRRLSLFKALNRPGQAQFFDLWRESQLIEWLLARAQQAGGQINAATARYLIERVGADPWLISQELDKLILYRSTIDQGSIDQVCTKRHDLSVFTIISAFQDRNPREFLQVADQLIDQGQSVQYLFSLVGVGLRQLVLVLESPKTDSIWQVARSLRLPSQVVTKIRRLSNWSVGDIKQAYQQLTNLDWAVKTGKMEGAVALDLLASKILHR